MPNSLLVNSTELHLHYFPAVATKRSKTKKKNLNKSKNKTKNKIKKLQGKDLYWGQGFMDSVLTEKEDIIEWLDLGQQGLESATSYIWADKKAQSQKWARL